MGAVFIVIPYGRSATRLGRTHRTGFDTSVMVIQQESPLHADHTTARVWISDMERGTHFKDLYTLFPPN